MRLRSDGMRLRGDGLQLRSDQKAFGRDISLLFAEHCHSVTVRSSDFLGLFERFDVRRQLDLLSRRKFLDGQDLQPRISQDLEIVAVVKSVYGERGRCERRAAFGGED